MYEVSGELQVVVKLFQLRKAVSVYLQANGGSHHIAFASTGLLRRVECF